MREYIFREAVLGRLLWVGVGAWLVLGTPSAADAMGCALVAISWVVGGVTLTLRRGGITIGGEV